MKPIAVPSSILLLSAGVATCFSATQCDSLKWRLSLPNTKVLETTFVAAGTNLTFPDNDATCGRGSQVVSANICRVSLFVTTSPTSNVSMEAWLPLDWNGRFLGVGNGGLAGCLKYEDVNYGVSHGFATAGANNGHNGTSGLPFYNNPGVVEDYVYRSVHLTAELGKQVTRKFYGKKHTKSYYLGCSTGGRQGFKEAQDFPHDFDGIVAGAPAFDLNALMYWTGQFYIATGPPGSETFLTASQWELVYSDILTQCDGLDGSVDGVLEDPSLCQYRPEDLICAPDQSSDCITGTQAATVRAVFSPVYGAEGDLVYPRLQPGANATDRFFAGEPHQYPVEWFRYAIYNDPNWDPATLNVQDWLKAKAEDPFKVSTWKGDLSAAKDRGTKILHYHGLEDNAITSDNSARYYDHVSRTMNLPSENLDDFYRYFRISGMAHCRGGNGAYMIGSDQATFTSYEPNGNALAAIVRWVEEGIAPDYILGVQNPGEGNMTRKHCKYPRRNVYKGTGDTNDVDNWECV
ncbi:tannase and feruloyl esterase [Dactylonectria macrodidyma]|uniref:Carboxylic ester hydrolase n=1 Tax=Dactylonectria macrodidyma TaxID=307937 RepID=A0A9P9FFX3_9HYPO|nr:tannase and feruloyl esterase [Dactylonectria macrodidyma]